jgi:ribose transport system permease protein
MRKELGIFVLLLALCAVVAVMNPRFLGSANLQNMARLIGMYGIFSIGLGIVIITGGIDLSVGSLFALGGVVLSILLVERHWAGPVAALAVVAGSTGLGWVHGLLITRVRLQPFIVTLCGLLFYRGVARFIANDETKGFGSAQGFESLRNLATGSLLGLPMPLVLLVLVSIVTGFLLHRSVYGRYLFAVGRNEDAARFAGVNSRRVVASAYVLSGLLAGIAGVLIAFYTNSSVAVVARQLLRTLRHRRGGAGRLLAARRRGLDRRHPDRHGPSPGTPEPGQPARHPVVAELRGDGRGDPARRARRRGAPAARRRPKSGGHDLAGGPDKDGRT